MRKYGHWGLALALSIPLVAILPFTYSVPIVFMMLIMALAPNWDIALGFLTRRGISHTIWFAVFMALLITVSITMILSMIASGFYELAGFTPEVLQPLRIGLMMGFGTFLGVMSHLLGDMMTTGGSKRRPKPLWPLLSRPLQFGIADERHPFLNQGLLKISITIVGLLYFIRLGVLPGYLH